jgi:signal transduction histidine kinase/CheY-like chemotaxis protein
VSLERRSAEVRYLELELARLGRQLEQRTQELEALAEINRAIAQPADLDRVLQLVVEGAARLTGADGGGIAFVREGEPDLEVGRVVGMLSLPRHSRLPLDGSITGRVVRTGVGEVVPELDRDPARFRVTPNPRPARSAIVVPLRNGQATIGGLIVVRGPERSPFVEEQKEILQRFADQASVAIEQARLVKRLEEANRSKEAFLATLSHELRTPITAILLWADLLQSEAARLESGVEGFAVITQSAELLRAMVDDLLDLSRLEAGKLRLERRLADIAVIARQALATLRRQAEERTGIVLVDELPPSLPPVWVDPARMQQVITNLLTNAVQFTEAPGEVRLRGRVVKRPEGEYVAVEVQDTGVGVPPELLPYIFDRFRQADPLPGRRHGGLGIGLALARALVDAHGGVIRVVTEVGNGSAFTVELPVARGEGEAADPGPAAAGDGAQVSGGGGPAANGWAGAAGPERPAPRGATVLIADDAEDTRQALAVILAAQGYRVLEAKDGEEAVALARAERPDVVLMDIAMPNLDGIAALGRLRADPTTRGIPVAAVTARAMPDDQRRIAAAGFDAQLTKPFRVPELLDLLAQLLAEPRNGASLAEPRP